VTLPERVEAVIAERMGRLAQPLRAALRVACVEGEVFTAEVVARVQAADGREVVGRLSRELDRRHRLVRAQAIERVGARRVSRYRFRNYLFQRYLYDSLDNVERAYLHEDVGNALEEMYGDQASDDAGASATAAVAVQLAWHFQEAGIAEKAIHYLRLAGERAVQLSAYQEGVAHLTRGLALLMDLPDTEEHRLVRAEQELALQLALGIAWTGPIGYGPEVEKALTRARELGRQIGETSQLCRVVGELSIVHYVQAEYQRARELAEEALNLAQQDGSPLLVALGHWRLGFLLFALGEYKTALALLEQVISFYDPDQHHRAFVFLQGSDAGPSALAYAACCLWCLGYPQQAAERSQEALALARIMDHPFSRADVVAYAGCVFNQMRRDAQALGGSAQELKRLANEKLPGWSASSTWYWGEALAIRGHLEDGIAKMQKGLALRQRLPELCYRSGSLCALAQAQARAGRPKEGLATLAEALAWVDETNERYCEAELHRVRAELLRAERVQGHEADAEASLQHAIEIARRKSAKSWELRATTSLARLWLEKNRRDEARQVLGECYGWFTEGFETPDLQEAKALLDELAQSGSGT
jgi:predicted ATPase